MKKQLLLLSLGLLLASCGTGANSTPASQPAGESEGTSSSESLPPAEESSEKTKADTLKELFAAMASTGICSYNDGMATSTYLGGDKGMLYVLGTRYQTVGMPIGYGISRLPNYGLVSYYYQNDTAGVDASSLEIVSPNKAVTFEDYDNSVKELGECGKVVTFTESARTHTFTTTDEDFVNALLVLDGNESLIDVYPTVKATVTLNDEGTEMTLGYILDGHATETKVSNTGMTISNVGTAKNTNVETFLASNPTITKPTAWSTDVIEALSSLKEGFTLPFPAGATIAASMPMSSLGNGIVNLFRDLGSGNISAAYGAALVAAGFVAEPDFNDPTNGLTGYSKVLNEAEGLQGKTTLYVVLRFTATTGENAKFYPNGIFDILLLAETEPAVVTAAQLNTELSQYKRHWAPTTNVFPTLDFGTNATKIEYMNQTEEYEAEINEYYAYYGYDVTFSFEISAAVNVYYPTLAEANAAVTALGTTFTAAGYNASATSAGVYQLSDPTQASNYMALASVEVAKSQTGAYAGYISMELDYYSIA